MGIKVSALEKRPSQTGVNMDLYEVFSMLSLERPIGFDAPLRLRSYEIINYLKFMEYDRGVQHFYFKAIKVLDEWWMKEYARSKEHV